MLLKPKKLFVGILGKWCDIHCLQKEVVFHLTLVIWCRACIAVNDRLFVIGGQEGDFMAKPGSPIFKCSRRHEV